MLETIFSALSPIDIIIGGISFLFGSFAGVRKLKNNPYRSLSIFLQVSVIVIKMAKHYYDQHPEKKQKLNEQIALRLDKISDQLYEYTNGKKEPGANKPPLG